ncbi:MAG: WecB/TagA/CpsF family glycosyltransferase [Gammaproteobacteria bacterium]
MRHRIRIFDIDIDGITLAQAVARMLAWSNDPTAACRSVFTPNLDHIVILAKRPEVRTAYRNASLVVADGWPIVFASRLLGRRLPERVAGSDLVPGVLAEANRSPTRPLRTFLLGAAPGVAERAAARIRQRWSSVPVVGCYSPPFGFENDAFENERILETISAAKPDLLIVGFGAPKQELWLHRYRDSIDARVAVAAGGTIDFMAGEQRRAPRWMQKSGLEWLHRMLSDPRRLALRYARDAWEFPWLLWREWWPPGPDNPSG